ncbi:Cysteine desulfurase [Alteripontixanthobacter maritimus]|uniref:Cysteine desulfurase n=2 Tax=Alteripontixanthobacter maritimus TaxID=2161824 RepID=A0A369QAK0_9SPHN|nr:Cysteine desulfurase [Alteripontixanthobacter maritimus]
MLAGGELWANPSSPHGEGRAARAALEDARARLKQALDWDGEVIFVSGASEAATLALGRAKGGARLVSAAEHDAILKAAPQAERLPVLPDGSLDLDILSEAVTGREQPVVAVQQINSETGNRMDLPGIGRMVREAGGLLLADCAQGAGKFALPDADMCILSAHKFGGPVGIGALLVRNFALLEPGGGQERGYRRGTENFPGVLAMVAALEACSDPYVDAAVLEPMQRVAERCRAGVGEGESGGVWLADRLADPTPYIAAIAMPKMSGSAQLMRLDMSGIAVSQGSACSSGSLKQSHVMTAMGMDEDVAARMIRVSFGWSTTRSEVERFADAWLQLATG